jgi:hypothetical protein
MSVAPSPRGVWLRLFAAIIGLAAGVAAWVIVIVLLRDLV